jgi:hypothetical protein
MVNKRISTTGVGTTAPITLYSNSPENTDLAPNFKVIIPGNIIGPMFSSSADLAAEEIDGEVVIEIEKDDEKSAEASVSRDDGSFSAFAVPSLGDISILSNSVVYDASGQPSVTAVFKIKNSSGKTLKGINVRVQSL